MNKLNTLFILGFEVSEVNLAKEDEPLAKEYLTIEEFIFQIYVEALVLANIFNLTHMSTFTTQPIRFLLFALFLLASQLKSFALVNGSYSFSQTNPGYAAIATGTTLGSTTNDEQVFIGTTAGTTTFSSGVASGTGFAIGFNFSLNGTTYTNFGVSTNGFIVLGNGTFPIAGATAGFYTPISNSQTSGLVSAISAFAIDLQGQALSTITYLSAGTAPNRTLTVQWSGYRRFNIASGDALNFQIVLNETSNRVDINYGTMTNGSTSNLTTEVGIRGATNADFNNRSVTNGTNTWATSIAGSANTSVAQFRNTFIPPSGQRYSWTPCGTIPLPTSSGGSACGLGTVALSATPGAGGTSCKWYDASSGGNLLTSGLTYSPSFTATGSTNFYVSTTEPTGCESTTRTLVTATINPTIVFDDGSAAATAAVATPAGICPGGSSTLSISPARAATSTPASGLAIPDNSATGVTQSISISGLSAALNNTTVRIAYVKVNVTHGKTGQLTLTLIAPDASTLNLSSNNGGNSANYTNTYFRTGATAITAGSAPFTGSFAPQVAFSTLNGKNPNGIWQLKVVDGTNATTGTFDNFEIAFIDANGLTYAWSNGAGTTVSPSVSPASTSNYNVVVTSATGSCSNTSANGTVTINSSPIITSCPSNITTTVTAGTCAKTVTYPAAIASGSPAPTITYSKNSNTSFGVGVTTVTVTATNTCGTATCTFTVTVTDNINPTFTGCPTNKTANTTAGNCTAAVTWVAPTASDNCSAVVTSTHTSGSIFPVGVTTVTYTATDPANNTATCSFTVTVTDNINPTFTGCPTNKTANVSAGNCTAAVTWVAPTASDNCSAVVTSTHTSGSLFPVGVTTVTYTATDPANNIATCSFTVTVTDNINPTLTSCPTNKTANVTAGNCTAPVSWTAPTASDNCSAVVTSTHTSGSLFPVGVTTVTYTATDPSNNTATCSFTVTVTDNINPTITGCPTNKTANTNAGNCTRAVTWVAPTASDNCSAVLTSTHISGSLFPVGVTTVTYTATDPANNTASCSFTVTVTDNQLPVISNCPTNISVNSDAGQCGAIVSWTVPTATDNCSVASFTTNHASGSFFPVGQTTTTYTAIDVNGNTSTCSFLVTVTDNQFPVISNCPGNITLNVAPGLCSKVASWTAPTATDNCTVSSFTSNFAIGSSFPVGSTTVTYTATDNHSKVSTCSFQVTVVDNENPIITCPSNISVNATAGNCGAAVTFAATATDNCTATVSYSKAPGTVFAIGTTTVTATATDASGNTASCSFTVTVTDNQSPVISGCPANISLTTTGGCTQVGTWTAPTATDNCSVVSFTSNHNSGDAFPIGTTVVTYTATDAAGHTTTCSFNVVVVDNENPTITCPANISVNATAGNCGAAVTFAATATDNCSATVSYSKAPGTLFAVGTTTVTATAIDASGNTASCSFTVTVIDNEYPVLSACPSNITSCNTIVTWTAPTATDNCSVTVSSNYNSGATFPRGTTTVTYSAIDASGNTTTCSFNVTVNSLSTAASLIQSSSGSAICRGSSTTLSVIGGSLGSGAQWVWYSGSCGGTFVGTGSAIVVSPNNDKTYFVRAEGTCNMTVCISKTITVVNGVPTGSVTRIAGPVAVCPFTSNTYSVNKVNKASYYTWSAPSGTLINGLPSPVNVVDTFATISFGALPGGVSGYIISVFAGNECGTTSSKTLYVAGEVSTPNFSNAPAVVCPGSQAVFSVASLLGVSNYIWSATGGATISGNGNSSVTITFPAGFISSNICVAAQNACGGSGPQRCMIVTATPGIPGAVNGPSIVCPGSTQTYSIAAVRGAGSYQWTAPAGSSISGPSNGLSVNVVFSAGFVSGLVQVTSASGCGASSNSRGKSVSTGKLGTPGNITGDPIAGVCGQTYQYSISSIANATLGYIWTIPAGVTIIGSSTSNSIILQFPSNFVSGTISVAGNNDCGPGYARSTPVYGNPSTPGVITGNQGVCNGSVEMYTWDPVSGANQYQVFAPSGAVILSGNVTTNTFALIQWGAIGGNISLKSVNACGVSGTRVLPVSISCRTAAEKALSDQVVVEAYPNPNHGKFSVSIDTRIDEKYTMNLVDQVGRILKVSILNATSGVNIEEFDLEGIAAGLYFLRIENKNKEVINKSIIIE